jgi:hypothetical protein
MVTPKKLLRLKAGYVQHTSPKSPTQHEKSNTYKERLSIETEASPAFQYWQNELVTKGEGTKQKYREYFEEFLDFIGKNPDELIVQRQQDLLHPDRKIQRRIESQLLFFISHKKAKNYAIRLPS